MNHGPKFQKVSKPGFSLASKLTDQLMAEIKADVREMQAKGNYGDGELCERFGICELMIRVLVGW
jgi:hypothetical protein